MSTLLPTQWTATTDQNTNQLLYEGATYWVQNSGKSWSFTAPTNDTLRFELRPYDGGASFDVPTVDRSEIAGSTRYAMGTDIHVSYDFQIEPGAANHAQWLALGQFHETPNDGWQQPYGMFLSGERMTFIIDNAGNTANDWGKYQTLWTDSQDIVRGHTYHMQIDARFDLTNGYLHVVRDGVTLIDYHGPMGWSGMDTVYWKEGLYRGASDTTIAADYSNLSITTGATQPVSTPPPSTIPVSGSDGTAGNDTLVGEASTSNHLRGYAGDDSITGGTQFNDINGNQGNDTIIGKSVVGDWLLGGQGADSINASASTGNNIVNGNIGNDTIVGGSGHDTLRGGQGDDVIHAGSGGDWISGDLGTNTIYGGQGADTFHAGAGHDLITGWQSSDHIVVDSGVTWTSTQVNSDVHVNFSNGGEMDLLGTQLSSLQSGWILNA